MTTDPTITTVKRLFAESGNQCSFPECVQILVDAEGVIYGEICHIAARNADGPRYDVHMADEERREYGNLLLLCRNHHARIDSKSTAHLYPVELLQRYKYQHVENTRLSAPVVLSDSQITQVIRLSAQIGVSIGQSGGQTAATIINQWPQPPTAPAKRDELRAMYDDFVQAVDDARPLQTVLSKARRIALHLRLPYWDQLFTMHLEGQVFNLKSPPAGPDPDTSARMRAELDVAWDRAGEPLRDPSEDMAAFLERYLKTKYCTLRPQEIAREIVAMSDRAWTAVEVATSLNLMRRVETRIWRRVNAFLAELQTYVSGQ